MAGAGFANVPLAVALVELDVLLAFLSDL